MTANNRLSLLLLVVNRPSSAWRVVTESLEITVSRLLKLKVIEIKECSFAASIEEKKRLETQLILERLLVEEQSLPKPILRVLLSPNAKKQFFLETELVKVAEQYRSLVIVVGGSNGVDEDQFLGFLKLTLSHLTFSHSLSRVVILEILKRAFLSSRAFRK